jgi:repressor LexA
MGRVSSIDITPRERDVLTFLSEYIKKYGGLPTIREIIRAVDAGSTTAIYNSLQALINKGFLKKNPNTPRAFLLTDKAIELLSRSYNRIITINKLNECGMILDRIDIIDVPIIENTSRTLSEKQIIGWYPIPSRFIRSNNNYIIKVSDETMENEGIMQGDLVLLKKQISVIEGDIFAYYIQSHPYILLKKYIKETEPFIQNVRILGIVKGVLRLY